MSLEQNDKCKASKRLNDSKETLEIVSMIKKYHNHKLQTTPWHREEEPTFTDHFKKIIKWFIAIVSSLIA